MFRDLTQSRKEERKGGGKDGMTSLLMIPI